MLPSSDWLDLGNPCDHIRLYRARVGGVYYYSGDTVFFEQCVEERDEVTIDCAVCGIYTYSTRYHRVTSSDLEALLEACAISETRDNGVIIDDGLG